MMEYEFLFVVEGVSVESDLDVGVVFDEFDGLLYSRHGRHFLAVSGPGREAVDAAHGLAVRLRRALPDIRLRRLDLDLVGVSDIAERTGRSRQNVLQWVNGERRVLQDPAVRTTITALPRTDHDRLVIACGVLSDPLQMVLDQIAPDDVSGLLAVRVEEEISLIGVASRALAGTRPISALGLAAEATVGDLVLALAHAEDASSAPLTLV